MIAANDLAPFLALVEPQVASLTNPEAAALAGQLSALDPTLDLTVGDRPWSQFKNPLGSSNVG